MKVNTPFGTGIIKEVMGELVQVELDNLYHFGNRDYYLWIFEESQIQIL